MNYCPNCGKELNPEFKVCPYCGHKLEAPKENNSSETNDKNIVMVKRLKSEEDKTVGVVLIVIGILTAPFLLGIVLIISGIVLITEKSNQGTSDCVYFNEAKKEFTIYTVRSKRYVVLADEIKEISLSEYANHLWVSLYKEKGSLDCGKCDSEDFYNFKNKLNELKESTEII